MSVTYRASVVCGFQVEIKTASRIIKKFNENTGEPYSIVEKSHLVAFVDEIEIGTTKYNSDAFYNGESLDGLEFGESGYESGVKWLGVVIGSVSEYHGNFHELNLVVPDAVQAFCNKHDLVAKWFLSMNC